MKLFSFKSQQKKKVNGFVEYSSVTDPINKLKDTLELLERREIFLEEKCQKEITEAKKKLLAKNKKAAIICLKRKAGYTAQIEKLGIARFNIEQQLITIESSKVNVEAMSAMKLGAQTMQKIHKNVTVDDIDETMMDIQEQMDISNQISEVISQSICEDEHELLAELDLLEQEELDAQLFGLQTSLVLPEIPNNPIPNQKEDEDALRDLEAEMTM